MMKIHIVIHESFESPAAIEQWAKHKKHEINYSRVYAGDRLPENPREFDLLIVMGGPQSPATTKLECPHFDSLAEQALIKQAVDAGKGVLGICLGAQLLGEALGAKFAHSPNKEIGVFEVILTDAAKNDPIFSQLPPAFAVAHWHGDMPGLTQDAQLLAYSEGCPRQIVRYTPKAYGFQCHFEFNQDAVASLIKHCGHEISAGGKYIQDADMLMRHNYNDMNGTLLLFLNAFEDLLTTCVRSDR